MGNRAIITWSKDKDISKSDDIGVYLHWNGNPASVAAFLAYCELKRYRKPDEDEYGYARLCQVIANYFTDGLSIGIEKCRQLDCSNNIYICKGWNIVKVLPENVSVSYSGFDSMLLRINMFQPAGIQIMPEAKIIYFAQCWRRNQQKAGKNEIRRNNPKLL